MRHLIMEIVFTVAIILLLPCDSRARAQNVTHSVTFVTRQQFITGLAVYKDGRALASIGSDGTLKLWDLRTNRELFSMKPGESGLRTVAVHPSGKWIVTGDRDSTINIIDLEQKRSVQKLKLETRPRPIGCLQFSADGKYLLSRNGFLSIWRVAKKGKVISHYKTFLRAALYAAISPDGKRIATMSRDRVILYDLESGEKIGNLVRLPGSIRDFTFSPDGRFLFAYRLFLPAEVVQIDIKKKTESSPFNIEAFGYAISPNGKWIAIADKDYKTTKCLAKVFDVASRQPILSLRYSDPVAISTGLIVFTPDNSKLITAVDSRIYIWDLPKKLLKK